MAANVLVSKGTSISIKVGNAFVKILGVTNISGLGSGSAAVIDTTDLDSTAKEKQLGIPDEGSVKVDMNYIPEDPGQVALAAARVAREPVSFKVEAKGKTKTYTYTFDALVPTFDRGTGVDKQWTASTSLEITGSVVETNAANT